MIKFFKDKIYRLLIYTQKFTKVDNVYLAKSGFWTTSFNIFSIFLSVITTIFFTRFCEKATYGYYQYILALVSTFSILSLPGINTAIIQSVTRGNDGSLFLGLKTKLKFSVFGSLTLFLIAVFFLFLKHDSLLASLVVISAIFFPFYFGFSCLFSFFTAKKQFAKLTLYQAVSRVLTFVTIVLTIIYVNEIFWIILLYFLISSIFNVWLYWRIKTKEAQNFNEERDIIPFGMRLTASNIIPQVLNNFDKLVLPIFLGVNALAVYAVAVKIPDTIKGVLNSFDNVFIPKLVGKKSEEFIAKIRNLWVFFAMVVFVAIIIFVLPFAIRLLFGSNYNDSIFAAQVYSIAILPFFTRRLINDWMLANKESGMYFKNISFWSVLTSLLILVGLFLYHDILSVIIAKIVAATITVIYGFYLLRRVKK